MSKLRLLGRTTSGNVQKPMWLLAEMGLDHIREDVGGDFGGNDTPEYLAMNPNGRVPLLIDGDTVIWESNTITRYLAARYGGERFWIADPARRAKAEMWMDWALTTMQPQVTGLFHASVRTPKADQDAARIATLARGSVKVLQMIEGHLERTGWSWVAGNELSIGDIPIGTQLHRYFDRDNERPAMPRVEAYYARMCERPAYREAVMTPYDGLIGVLPYSQQRSRV
jgi:glutathione S-transferase